jgi:hypothetical protein
MIFSATAFGQDEITVTCFPSGKECVREVHPNPLHMPVGHSVQFFLSASCVTGPFRPCTVNVPAGPGLDGFDHANITEPVIIGSTDTTDEPGVFTHTVACSGIQGPTIVSRDRVSSMTHWGLIGMAILVVATEIFLFARRRLPLAQSAAKYQMIYCGRSADRLFCRPFVFEKMLLPPIDFPPPNPDNSALITGVITWRLLC